MDALSLRHGALVLVEQRLLRAVRGILERAGGCHRPSPLSRTRLQLLPDVCRSARESSPNLLELGRSHGSREIEAEDTLGDSFFPTEYTALTDGGGDPPLLEPGGFWNFSDTDGNVLCPDEEFEQAGWFGGEALAPVQQGGKWAYVDTEGNFATEFVYESCWGDDYVLAPETGEYTYVSPIYAFSLWEGFAPVLRDGKWGVLDENGAEIVPCSYEGAAPYPGGAWLKSDGQWGLYLLA